MCNSYCNKFIIKIFKRIKYNQRGASLHSDKKNYYQQQIVLNFMKFIDVFQVKIGVLYFVRISEDDIFIPNYVGVK